MNAMGKAAILVVGLQGGLASARYLSPEPLLQSPAHVRQMAQGGMSVPTYAYGLNNSLRYVDFTGLDAVDFRAKRFSDWVVGPIPPPDPARKKIRDAYDNWWANRPEQFRLWGPISNAKRFFGDKSAPVCKQYGEAAAEGINSQLGDGDGWVRSLWDWQADDGSPRAPVRAPSHDNVRVFGPDGKQYDTFDPWWRW